MRARLRSLLQEDEQLVLIADSGELAEAVGHVLRARARVLVLDMSLLPSGSSIEALRRLRAHIPGCEIVALKMRADGAFARRAFGAGVIAFVLKDGADGELLDAVALAARGERYVSARIAGELGGSLPGRRRGLRVGRQLGAHGGAAGGA